METTSLGHIFLSSPHMSDEGYEMNFVNEAFESNWIAPLGKNVDEFERELASKIETNYAAALVSGTSAIHMALKSLDINKDDIVFCSSLTFAATANPICYQNAIPVFIDSEEDTWNMSPLALKAAFNKYPKVKAVILVHLYGIAAKVEEIKRICDEFKVPLIEDAAESLGTTYKGKYTGTFGEYGVFSFNGNKIITTSGGGMLVCNISGNKGMLQIEKVRFWATQSRDKARHYQHSEIGYNYRMSNILAGIGRGQLMVLEERIKKKQYIYNFYKGELGHLEGLEMMPISENEDCNCWLSCIQLSGKIRPLDIMIALEEADIESRPIWKPLHLQPIFSGFDFIKSGEIDVSKKIFENGVCLPSDTKLVDGQLYYICSVVKGLFNHEYI